LILILFVSFETLEMIEDCLFGNMNKW